MQREKSFSAVLQREKSGLLYGSRRSIPGVKDTAASVAGLVHDLTSKLKQMDANARPESTSDDTEKSRVEALVISVGELMQRVKNVIFPPELEGVAGGGSSGEDAAAAAAIGELTERIVAQNTIPLLLLQLVNLEFETRKLVSTVFVYLLRNDPHFSSTYLEQHQQILGQLVDCYNYSDAALPAGIMLRECIKVESMHRAFFVGPDGALSHCFKNLLELHVHNLNFDVASDAFETLQCVLTVNKSLVLSLFDPEREECSRARYDDFIARYNTLIQGDNYVLKRQSLKLLSEFLLERKNFSIMMQYISSVANLKVIMKTLSINAANIQFEAFHVFKVFVANPEKTPEIIRVLFANKAKIISFLEGFQNEKDDEQFREEKEVLIGNLQALADVEIPGVGGGSGGK